MAGKNKKPDELYLTRVYDAPVKLVWDAWVDPEKVGKWWGPRGFTLTTKKKDVRTGGTWTYTMHGPDGVDWPNHTVFHEVEKYQRMVYDHGAGGENQAPLFRVTVTFEELKGGKTKLDFTMKFASAEKASESKKFIKQANGHSTWDRLAEFLDKETKGKETFVINHSYAVPVETLFEMWANPDHLKNWMGPAGSTMEFLKADIRPGGSSLYMMEFMGNTMYGRCRYLEIKRPELLVYEQEFTDKTGTELSRHPMAPTWPATMKTTVSFASEGENESRVKIEWEVVGNASKAEMETFVLGRAGMNQGWEGSLDKLEEYLSKR